MIELPTKPMSIPNNPHPLKMDEAVLLLVRFPAVLQAFVSGLPEATVKRADANGGWSAYEILAHLVSAERTNWIQRIEHIVTHGESRRLATFDRTPQPEGRTVPDLLQEFAALREHNLEILRNRNLTEVDLSKTGLHAVAGSVTVGNLIATWAAHDLTHLHQLSRLFAGHLRDAVGPFSRFLGVMHCNGHGD